MIPDKLDLVIYVRPKRLVEVSWTVQPKKKTPPLPLEENVAAVDLRLNFWNSHSESSADRDSAQVEGSG